MAIAITEHKDAVTPTAEDARLARDSSRRLARLLTAKSRKPFRVQIAKDGKHEETISIPRAAFRLLGDILREMAKGNAFTLIPVQTEMTTQQAAAFLNVSRPFLVEQLEKGMIPYRKIGTHRRVLFKDLMAYKNAIDKNRHKALQKLSAVDQALGLGY